MVALSESLPKVTAKSKTTSRVMPKAKKKEEEIKVNNNSAFAALLNLNEEETESPQEDKTGNVEHSKMISVPTEVPIVTEDSNKSVKAPRGYVRTTRTNYRSNRVTSENSKEEHVIVPVFHGNTATVAVSAGYTLNLGNYESARIDVSISLPCLPEETEIRRCYEEVTTMVDTFLLEEQKKVKDA